jgi:uncharacterized membrane protein YfcA
MSYARRIRDIAVETSIAVVLVTAFVAYLFRLPKGSSLDWRRIAEIINTMVVFGFLSSWFRHAWRNSLFWIALTVLLLIHFAAYAFVLGRIQHWPSAYYIVLNAIELALFTQILSRLPLKRELGKSGEGRDVF